MINVRLYIETEYDSHRWQAIYAIRDLTGWKWRDMGGTPAFFDAEHDEVDEILVDDHAKRDAIVAELRAHSKLRPIRFRLVVTIPGAIQTTFIQGGNDGMLTHRMPSWDTWELSCRAALDHMNSIRVNWVPPKPSGPCPNLVEYHTPEAICFAVDDEQWDRIKAACLQHGSHYLDFCRWASLQLADQLTEDETP